MCQCAMAALLPSDDTSVSVSGGSRRCRVPRLRTVPHSIARPQVVPGSHLFEQLPHRDTFGANNMLSRGQEVAVAVDPAAIVNLELQPGEMSIHHTMLIHGSQPNRSDIPRIGFAIRYIAARVSHGPEFRDSATLVRGADVQRHYVPEPRPSQDFDPGAQAIYDEFVGEHQRRKAAVALKNAG